MLQRAADWFDERTGYRSLLASAADEPVPGGARWSYVWGSCLVFVLIVQAATGVVMATVYSPSTATAWASVAYLQDQMLLGWVVRGLHAAGASAMVILLGLHMVQTAVWGAYKRPREMNWATGVVLGGLTLGFALTGYLLPWDQKGYWATQVATSLLGASPGGATLAKLAQGGDVFGNLTLTRFYSLHVFVLPSGVGLFTAIHVALFRRHGVTPSWRLGDEEARLRAVPFWPEQVVRDLAAMTLVFGLMALWVFRHHGANLEAPADPTASYDARPEWYFLPLFQLLKQFPGRLEIPAALGAPTLVVGLLLSLPFLDRLPGRSPSKRRGFLLLVFAILGAALVLGWSARSDDAASTSFRAQREKAESDATRARKLAQEGVLPPGGTAVWQNDPAAKARKLLTDHCLGCHSFGGAGEARAPALDGWSSRTWIAGMLATPDDARYYGPTKIHGMKPFTGDPTAARALTEYLFAEGGGAGIDETLRQQGEALLKSKDCDECHEHDGKSAGAGPNFGGRGSPEWIRAFLADPSAPRFFGKKNEMPKFADKLSSAEIDALAGLLAQERAQR